jgi:cyclic beta-1,2-glucan synthetase
MNLGSLWRRPSTDGTARPLRDELLGADRLEDRALSLAARFTIDPRARATSVRGRFEENARVLQQAYKILATDVRAGRFVTAASEWLLDNYHLVATQIAEARRNLPQTYYRQLPPLSTSAVPASTPWPSNSCAIATAAWSGSNSRCFSTATSAWRR